jgi:beta-phosphoglucomutase-like phosphatase (HAD superfamily)
MGIRDAVSALLFDFDGTITETEHLWSQVTRTCFAAHGSDIDEATLARLLTSPWLQVVPGLSQQAALAIERDIIDAIRPAYLECPPVLGLDAFLEQFAGIPKAIVTSSYREQLVSPYLRKHGLDRHFPVVVGAEDTECLKPSPEPVLLALRLLEASRQGAWLIGDSPADAEAARSAGIRAVGLGSRATGSDLFADSMQALGAIMATPAAEDVHSSQ